MSRLVVENLKVDFQTRMGIIQAVDDVSFDLKEKETLTLVGETGCGKSVVAHAILKLLPLNARVEGQILHKGRDLLQINEKELSKIRGREISLVIQNPSLALNPVYSVGHQIIEPLIVHENQEKSKALQQAKQLLARLRFRGPGRAVKMYPFQLSGGMKQRVLIGISVVLNPGLVIADEPTKGLDEYLKKLVLEELRLAKEINQSSLILITHDLETARNMSERIVIMYAGEIIEMGDTQDFFKNPLHPYSRGLLDSLPERGFKPIPGTSPSPLDLPAGCRFHPRCLHRRDICLQKIPDLFRIEERDVRCVLFN